MEFGLYRRIFETSFTSRIALYKQTRPQGEPNPDPNPKPNRNLYSNPRPNPNPSIRQTPPRNGENNVSTTSVALKPDLDDQLASFSALTQLVGSSGL